MGRQPWLAAAVAIALGSVVALAVLAATAFVPRSTGLPKVLYLEGTVLRVPGLPVIAVTVPSSGAELTGTVDWDHTSSNGLWIVPNGTSVNCSAGRTNYSGPAWTQNLSMSLTPGEYVLGALCGTYGNGTVTATVELVSP